MINTKSLRKLPIRFLIALKDWFLRQILYKYTLYIVNTLDRENVTKKTSLLLASAAI